MHLIKVDAINSTNSFARQMFKETPEMSTTCIVARQQLEGRGQRGTSWLSQPGQNLTFSLIFPNPRVSPSCQFLLSASVSTAVVEALNIFEIPKLKVKWPNDIMTANYKIGGILIENVITEGALAATIIGVGLNVNQTTFPDLPAAGSLKLAAGRDFDLDEVLARITTLLEQELENVRDSRSEEILRLYKNHLFRINIPSTFELPDKTLLTGIIEDVGLNGKLKVKIKDDLFKEFDLKEIQLCY